VDARALANLGECVRQCDLDLCGVVSASYAAGLAALVEDEQRTGAVCLDMGAGGTGLSLFLRDHLICAERIRFGAEHVTSDIAGGLLMLGALAERIKTRYGGAIATAADDRDPVEAPRLGDENEPVQREISRGMLIGVIRPRMEELFRAVHARLVDLGVGQMPGCSVVLTGGGCQMPGLDELCTRILGRRPRIGRPLRIPRGAAGCDRGRPRPLRRQPPSRDLGLCRPCAAHRKRARAGDDALVPRQPVRARGEREDDAGRFCGYHQVKHQKG